VQTEFIVIGAVCLILLFIIATLALRRRRATKVERLGAAYDRARYARRTGTMGSDRGYIR